ncbi:MAG: HAD family hydrolase [Chitinispirillaceae bacterium]|nr:HAD family hydrolase [Chitinispirillaceae bacterium]
MRISSLIYDFDGTLVDSRQDVFESLMHAFSSNGIPVDALQAEIIMQMQLPEAVTYAAPGLPVEKRNAIIEAFKKHYDASDYPNTTLMPGARELLEKCLQKSIPCYIVSNKRQYPMLKILEKFNLRKFFSAVYNPDVIESKKLSKAELLAQAVMTHGLDRNSTAYIGDMDADVQAARENGLISMVVANGYGVEAAKASRPEVAVKNLLQIRELIFPRQT